MTLRTEITALIERFNRIDNSLDAFSQKKKGVIGFHELRDESKPDYDDKGV
jgi:hypothetical protein